MYRIRFCRYACLSFGAISRRQFVAWPHSNLVVVIKFLPKQQCTLIHFDVGADVHIVVAAAAAAVVAIHTQRLCVRGVVPMVKIHIPVVTDIADVTTAAVAVIIQIHNVPMDTNAIRVTTVTTADAIAVAAIAGVAATAVAVAVAGVAVSEALSVATAAAVIVVVATIEAVVVAVVEAVAVIVFIVIVVVIVGEHELLEILVKDKRGRELLDLFIQCVHDVKILDGNLQLRHADVMDGDKVRAIVVRGGGTTNGRMVVKRHHAVVRAELKRVIGIHAISDDGEVGVPNRGRVQQQRGKIDDNVVDVVDLVIGDDVVVVVDRVVGSIVVGVVVGGGGAHHVRNVAID